MALKTDFYHIWDWLKEDERLILETVRAFVDKEVIPVIGDYWLRGEFPTHLIPRMAEMGFFGPTLPEEYGGQELSYTAYGIIAHELERGDSGLRSFVSVQSSLCMYSIFTFGSEEQKKKYLPEMAKAKLIGCFGLTEPDSGSDPGSMKTKARKDGSYYILNGSKMWITNGSIADLAIVFAKDDEGEIRGFIVEKDTPGFSAREIKGKLSLRASDTSELVLEDARVHEKYVLPKAVGLKSALMPLTQARYTISWGVVGAATFCFEEALDFSGTRIAFGKPISAFQLTQKKFADMLTDITGCQLIALRLGRLADEGKMKHYHVSLAKRHNTRKALEISREARNILGANGITIEYHSMRHSMNLESVDTYEGTYEIHTLILGKTLTGIEAYGG